MATRMGAEIELISATGGEVTTGGDDDRMGLRVGAVEDSAWDDERLLDIVAVAEVVVMEVEDACDGGRLVPPVDSVTQAELVVVECVAVEIEERVLEHTEVVADEVAVQESLNSSVEQ